MSKWELHVKAVQLIRRHPDWDDEKIAEAVGIKSLEMDIVAEARREVVNEQQPGTVRSERSY